MRNSCHRTQQQLSDYFYLYLLLQTAEDTAEDQATRAPVPVPAGQGRAGALLGCSHPLQETRTGIPGHGRCKLPTHSLLLIHTFLKSL